MKLRPEIYEKAAELIAKGQERYACCAIDTAGEALDGPHTKEFEAYFRPRRGSSGLSPWFGHYTEPERQCERITSLLFMAETVRSEGR